MTTLEYVNFTDPPQFTCTGDEYFPAGLYTLVGKFPLHWNDLYENSDTFHRLNDKRVKLIGFTTSCTVGKYSCHITVETTNLKILEEISNLNSIAIDLS
jgi:hypothetical protein